MVVIHGDAYYTVCTGEEQPKVAALGDFFHVVHGAVVVVCEPGIEAGEIAGVDFCRRKSDEIEAEGFGDLFDLLLNMHMVQ